MKKCFCLLLAICLAVGILPATASAVSPPEDTNADAYGNLVFEYGGVYYRINLKELNYRDEDEEWWGLATVVAPPEGEVPYTGQVYIPASVEYKADFGDGYYKVSAIGDNAFQNSQITNISFGDFSSFGYIGAYAFAGCSKLSGALTAASVTRIGSYAFQNTQFDLTVMVNNPGLYTVNSFEGVGSCKMKYIAPMYVHAYSNGKVDFMGVGTPDARYKLILLRDGDEVTTVYVGANTDASNRQYTYTFAPEHFSQAGRYTVSVQAVEPENYNKWVIADSDAAKAEFPVKVTFDASGRGIAPDSQEVSYGSKITKPADPTDTELVFAGWYEEAACENKWDFDKDTVTENITLYAKWTAPLSLSLDTEELTRASAAFSWTPVRISQDPDDAGRINGLVYDDIITLTVRPDFNCKFNSVPELTLTNAGRSVPTEQSDGSYTWTITHFAGDATVSIRGTAIMQGIKPDIPDIPIVKVWFVTLPAGEGYTAKAAEGFVSTVQDGKDYSFTVTVAEGYNGDAMVVRANGTALTEENGVYTIENVNADQRITVEGIVADNPPMPANHRITLSTEGSGSATASAASAVKGTNITLSATPDSGWYFKEWVVISGGIVVSSNEFTMPDNAVEIKAVFEETAPPASSMQIYIVPATGETVILDMSPADSIENVKQRIQEETGISPEKQILVFGEKTLEDGRTLVDYNIQNGDTLHLSLTDDLDEPDNQDKPEIEATEIPATGDRGGLALFGSLLLFSVTGLAGLEWLRRRRRTR